MEQPRFGGVALPPLSSPSGEGMSPESVTMESTKVTTLDLHLGAQDRHSDAGRADPDVEKVMGVLRQLGTSPRLERHKVKHERQRDGAGADSGIYCKNLLLKDKKGQAYLILCAEDDTADLHVVKYHLKAQGNLHFASEDSLWRLLRVRPGAVSPLALIYSSGDVRVLIDASLVKKIDREFTKLYFHPLKAELQVGLTLSLLERFLHHCGVALETLPSLTSYSAGRRYGSMTGGCYKKRKANPEQKSKSNLTEFKTGDAEAKKIHRSNSYQEAAEGDMEMDQAENTLTQHVSLFQQLGVSVEVVPAKGNEGAASHVTLPCKSIYLKDKRNNYFLFICHQNQKVDFSALKQQLKPRKKIEPLENEELWSLLHLHENQEHPFALAQLKHPRFLVAISDNLYYGSNVVLTFPHPSDRSLHVEITLRHLEVFINNTGHDLTTVQMKGNTEELQAMSASPGCFSSPRAAHLSEVKEHSEAESERIRLPESHDERHSCQRSSDQEIFHTENSPAGLANNLFFRLTTPLRVWILRHIRSFVQLLNQHLPGQVLAVLRKWPLWSRMLTSRDTTTEDRNDSAEEPVEGPTCREKEKAAKIAKLQQLIKQCGIQVHLRETQPQARVLKDNAEQCKTYLLEDGTGRLFIVLCTEEDNPSQRNLRRLRTAFRSRSALHLASEARMSGHLRWPEQSSMSWDQEDLSPLALMDMNLVALGRIRVGMTGTLYSFPDTVLNFDLPSLGVSLRMSSDDLEIMIQRLGFCIVYLP